MRYHQKNYLITGFTLLILLIIIIGGQVYFFDQLFIHLSFHSAIEALGALAALVLSFLILHSFDQHIKEVRFTWIPCALIGMGVLDLFHSFTMPGESFVWLHSTAMFIGGLLFAMVWIPKKSLQSMSITALPKIILASSTIFGLFFIMNPQAIPVMVENGGFSNTAELLNIVGGCLFISASAWFFLQYRQNRSVENVLFANHCLLFGIAGILFDFSELWDAEWWLWHGIRLLAYLLALFYIFFLYRQADATLRSSRLNLQKAQKIAHLGSWERDIETGKEEWSDEMFRVFGFQPGEVEPTYDLFVNSLHPLDRERVLAAIQNTLNTNGPYNAEFRIVLPNGRGKTVLAQGEVYRDLNSRALKMLGTILDITERKKTEESLRESEEKFQSLYSTMNEGVGLFEVIYNDAGRAIDYKVIDANPAFERVLGLKWKKTIGRRASKIYSSGEPPYLDIFAEVAATEIPTSFETYFSPMQKHFNVSVFSPGKGKFATVFSDITESKKTEEALRESENKYRRLVESIEQRYFLYSHDIDGVFTYLSPSITNILGYSPEEFLTHYSEYLTDNPVNMEVEKHTQLSIKGKQQPSYEIEIYHKDGGSRWLIVSEVPVFDAEGKVVAVEGLAHDFTERKLADEELSMYRENLEKIIEKRSADLKETHDQLLHAEKLSAIGKLSASIAHEFNNPLFGIRNVLGGIKQRAPLDEDDTELVDMALKECDRIKYLIQDLQDFNRPTSGVMAPLDLHRAINSILLLFKNEFKRKQIQVEKQYAQDLPAIRAVSDQIKQVLLNLLRNGVDAIPQGRGTITISTEKIDKRRVAIHIHDTGVGIKPEDMAHIFDPFFSTKPDVKGTGLGLSVSYGIIKRHQGNIEVHSEVGKGSTFTITLPIRGPA